MGKYDVNSSARSHQRSRPPSWMSRGSKRRRLSLGCSTAIGLTIIFFSCIGLLALVPVRTSVILIGLDFGLEGSNIARSDTIILTTFVPLKPYVGMLSIPRDLWVGIPGYGENRINTAHFFAEAASPGAGPDLLTQTIYNNFGVQSKYYVRIHFNGFRELINIMGGIDVTLDKAMAGYPAGTHHLNGNKALAFARNRSGTDDFFRMEQGQIIIRATLEKLLQPLSWYKLPFVFVTLAKVTESNVPWWTWPRIVFTLLRTGYTGIDYKIIERDMVTPYITSQGANVLIPDWPIINEVVGEMFHSDN